MRLSESPTALRLLEELRGVFDKRTINLLCVSFHSLFLRFQHSRFAAIACFPSPSSCVMFESLCWLAALAFQYVLACLLTDKGDLQFERDALYADVSYTLFFPAISAFVSGLGHHLHRYLCLRCVCVVLFVRATCPCFAFFFFMRVFVYVRGHVYLAAVELCPWRKTWSKCALPWGK